MILADIIGSIGATLTTISFLPQAIKVIKTKEVEDLSLWMYILFSVGVFFWLLYGIMLWRYPMMMANSITLLLALSILYVKIKEG